ncbi:hypothetical protein BC835DRAFT_1305047 [Cytidiella melzeri]|nr:hypothetical protein BC835DRAFT_1305047 [Cytidiella melzeri]
MCGLVILQMLISLAHSGVCLEQLLEGFLSAPNAEAYFSDQGQPSHIAQNALYLCNNVIADSVLVWRLYIVFNKNKWICIPYVILILGATASFIGALHTTAGRDTLAELYLITLGAWLTAYWSITIAIQATASCLIAYKILVIRNQFSHVKSVRISRSMSVVWIILESGAVLSLTTILLLGFYTAHKSAGAVVAAIGGQLSALIPVSILLRVALNNTSLFAGSAPASPSTLVGFQRDSALHSGSEGTTIHIQRSVDINESFELYQSSKQLLLSLLDGGFTIPPQIPLSSILYHHTCSTSSEPE